MGARVKYLLLVLLVVTFPSAVLPAQAPNPGEVSAADYKVVVVCNQKASMRDGVQIALDIFRPKGVERCPAVLCQTCVG